MLGDTRNRAAAAALRSDVVARREAGVALAYFAVYLGYLFVHPEGEVAHWIGLVLLPLTLLAAARRSAGSRFDFGALLLSIGLRRGFWRTGLGWGLLAGLLIAPVQLFAQNGAEVRHLLSTVRGLWLVAGGFLLVLGLVHHKDRENLVAVSSPTP